MEKRTRDKELTKQKLLNAVGKIVREHGIDAVGINSVAREAGTDKVLIYRYFENLDGLMYAYIMSKDFYGNISKLSPLPEKITSIEQLMEYSRTIFVNMFYHLKNDIELQEIYKWELKTLNNATRKVAEKREELGHKLTNYMTSFVEDTGIDSEALLTVLVSSINYIVLRSATVDIFNGIKINEPEGEKRILEMIDNILRSYISGLHLKANS
ncbi:MAG: TetR/AcrR family transcriptional regulator [Bacteroidota bacterium]|nr:TetR/AcrR family transcriptional regulator [Bacteroidota bacterium]